MKSVRSWTAQRACDWYDARPVPCGFNYLPRTAINPTEMWQAETFDLKTIDEELGWANAIGFNSCRVSLQFLVWETDPEGMLSRFAQFLDLADAHGLTTMPVLFDDCACDGAEPYLGPQAAPLPGIHNPGWTACPGHRRAQDRETWPSLKAYAQAFVERFAGDERVLLWDVYNEPGNDRNEQQDGGLRVQSLPLLRAAFEWVREVDPSQPLTCGVWYWHESMAELNREQLAQSDVVSFHDYNDLTGTQRTVERLREEGRPMLCTEWLRRGFGNEFSPHLPYFRQERVGSYFWGLVNGKCQTHFPWGSPEGAPEPEIWFHDLLRAEGTPRYPSEVSLIGRRLDSIIP